ncbi:MAG: prenyltransferase/squalene oxidase repeat-containing protein, partial [bacterium]
MKRFNLLVLRLILVGLLVQGANAISQEVSINKGISWLISNQNPDGTWGNLQALPSTCFEDTQAVLETFWYLGTITGSFYTKGLSWLSAQDVSETIQLSEKINILAHSGSDASTLVATLTLYQNQDGGFGADNESESRILDTIFTLNTLKSANYSNNSVIEPAIAWLIANQNPDGGFGLQESNV